MEERGGATDGVKGLNLGAKSTDRPNLEPRTIVVLPHVVCCSQARTNAKRILKRERSVPEKTGPIADTPVVVEIFATDSVTNNLAKEAVLVADNVRADTSETERQLEVDMEKIDQARTQTNRPSCATLR